MKKIRAFLFDMDGLLMDTETLHIQAYVKLTAKLGCPQPAQAFERFIGLSHKVSCKWLIEELGCRNTYEELVAMQQELYYEVLRRDNPPPLPGVREIFNAGDERKFKRALVSSSVGEQVDPTMQILSGHLQRGAWKTNFQAICTGDRVSNLKPAPDLYQLAMKELELEPQECIAFEDSPAGISAAHAAGCRVVAIPNRYLRGQDVAKGRAQHQFETLLHAVEKIAEVIGNR